MPPAKRRQESNLNLPRGISSGPGRRGPPLRRKNAMRIAATLLAVVVASGCASRQSPPSTAASRSAAPVNYEATVTTYFDLTSSTPPAQRKLLFGAPETTGCGVLGSSRGHLGWVVPVTHETTAPPPSSASALAPPAALRAAEPPVQRVKTLATAAKGKTKGRPKAAVTSPAAVTRVATPRAAAVAAAVAPANPVTPSDTGVVMLDKVSVIGRTYFFWFNKEMINAVTRRMDICP